MSYLISHQGLQDGWLIDIVNLILPWFRHLIKFGACNTETPFNHLMQVNGKC